MISAITWSQTGRLLDKFSWDSLSSGALVASYECSWGGCRRRSGLPRRCRSWACREWLGLTRCSSWMKRAIFACSRANGTGCARLIDSVLGLSLQVSCTSLIHSELQARQHAVLVRLVGLRQSSSSLNLMWNWRGPVSYTRMRWDRSHYSQRSCGSLSSSGWPRLHLCQIGPQRLTTHSPGSPSDWLSSWDRRFSWPKPWRKAYDGGSSSSLEPCLAPLGSLLSC